MKEEGFRQIDESGNFGWPWQVNQGLMIIFGASGGGGAFCSQGLNPYGGGGGAGRGCGGFVKGKDGSIGNYGSVYFVPLCD